MKKRGSNYRRLMSWGAAAFLFVASSYTIAVAQPANISDLVLSEQLIGQLADPNLQLSPALDEQLLVLNPSYSKVTVSRQDNIVRLEFIQPTPAGDRKLSLTTNPQMWLVTQMGPNPPSPQERVAGWLRLAEQPHIKGIESISQDGQNFWRITAQLEETAPAGIGPPGAGPPGAGPPPGLKAEAGPAESPAAKPQSKFTQKIMNSKLVVNFKKGGFIMYLILMCSIGGLYIALERAYVLRRKRLIPDKFVQEVLKRFSKDYEEHKHDELIRDISSYCEDKDIPAARTLKSGLMVYHEGILGVKSAISSTNAHEGAIMERGIGLLGVFANISPLLGLLGTVTGMIKAFEMISIGGSGHAEVVASGISEALITTAGGLFVGIPLLLLFFFFQNKIDAIMIDLEEFSLEIVEKLIARGEESA